MNHTTYNKKRKTRTTSQVVSLRMTAKTAKDVSDASLALGLRKADVMRMSLERGVSILLAQLTNAAK